MAFELTKIRGLDELVRTLESLPKDLGSKGGGPLRQALFLATKPIRDEARARAPVKTGKLKSEIIASRDKSPGRSGATERYRVGVRKSKAKLANTKANRRKGVVGQQSQKDGDPFYWRFLEFGTEKLAARPFLVPAFEAQKKEALAQFIASFDKAVTRAAKKASARSPR